MPSSFPWSPVIREWLRKKIQIEKKFPCQYLQSYQVKMDDVGFAVGLKPFIKTEIEKLGAEADAVTGGCWLDLFVVSWSRVTPSSVNFHLCVYSQVLSKILKPISRHFLSSISWSTMMAKIERDKKYYYFNT